MKPPTRECSHAPPRLLQAAEGYARHSGCRFRKGSFSQLPMDGGADLPPDVDRGNPKKADEMWKCHLSISSNPSNYLSNYIYMILHVYIDIVYKYICMYVNWLLMVCCPLFSGACVAWGGFFRVIFCWWARLHADHPAAEDEVGVPCNVFRSCLLFSHISSRQMNPLYPSIVYIYIHTKLRSQYILIANMTY